MCSLREKKKQQTRERIAVAAVSLLAELGEENTTVARIAERAGVSARTFHNYFPNRDDAFEFFLENLLKQWIQEVNDTPTGQTPLDIVKHLVLGYARRPEDDPYRTQNLMRVVDYLLSNHRPELERCAGELLREFSDALYKHAGESAGYVETHVVATLGILAGKAALEMGSIAPYEEILDVAFNILENGVNKPRKD